MNFYLDVARFIDGTALSSGQRLDNVNQTHLVLANGKLVLQKKRSWILSLISVLRMRAGVHYYY